MVPILSGHPPAAQQLDAGERLEFSCDLNGKRRPAGRRVPQRTDIPLLEARLGADRDPHRRNAWKHGHAAFDLLQRGFGVEAGMKDQRLAVAQRPQHHRGQCIDVEQRKDEQHALFARLRKLLSIRP